MEYRNIITFLRVAEQQSFVRAAGILGYSPAAVTVQIKQLEKELDTLLFDRIGTHIRLTTAGEGFLPYAKDIVRAHQAALEFQHEELVPPGRLYIDAASSLSSVKMPAMLTMFSHLYPQIQVYLRTTDYMLDEFEKLSRNEIDFLYLLDKLNLRQDAISTATRLEPVIFVGSVKNPLTKKELVTLEEIVSVPFLITNREISYCYYLDQHLAARGLRIEPLMEISATDVIARMLEDNVGISYLPRFTVADGLRRGVLAPIRVDCPEITVWSQLLYHKNKWLSPQMRAFIEFTEHWRDENDLSPEEQNALFKGSDIENRNYE